MKRAIVAVVAIVAVGCVLRPIIGDCTIAGCPSDKTCAAETHTCVPRPTPTPAPTPSPEPTPAPTPAPTPPSPVCEPPAVVYECWHQPPGEGWQYIPAPPPPPPEVPTYEMGNYWLYPDHWVADATPRQCGFAHCEAIGFPGRRCCPAAPEADPTRYDKEVEMMGGPRPLWTLEVTSGNLTWEYEDDWKAQVWGTGVGRLRACFPNGRACGDWLTIAR